MTRYMIKRAKLVSAIAVICMFTINVNAQWSGPSKNEWVIVGGWLFDGTDDERKPNPGIVIRNGKFASLGVVPAMTNPDNTTVIEIDSEATILPGMFDLHAHYNYDLVWTDEAQYFTPYARQLLDKRGPPPPESDPVEFNQRLVELRKFHEAGGADLLIVGTDEPIYTTLLPGFAYHRELMAMAWAGIPPADVLRAATINGARALGVDDRLGSIEAGKLADFVVVRGNPLEDIKVARDIQLVIKNGVIYRPGELLEQVKDKIGPKSPTDHADWVLHVKPLRN